MLIMFIKCVVIPGGLQSSGYSLLETMIFVVLPSFRATIIAGVNFVL